MIFKGSGVAIITPFDKENNIDYIMMEKLIEYQIANFTDAIIVCGTTGESATLSTEEKKMLIKFTVDVVNKRIPVIAGTGSNNTQAAIEMSKYAEEVGVDALLVVTPYYNKCSQSGLYNHFKVIANNVKIPIILYNVPSRTGVNIELNTLLKLEKVKNICGIKEASGNISQIAEIINSVSKNFAVYSGNDDQILPILAMGGHGVISVAANIIPEEIHNLCDSIFNFDLNSARELQYKYLNLIKKLFIDVNPIPIKEAMNILKCNVGKCRMPLSKMDEKNIISLKEALSDVKYENNLPNKCNSF